MKVISIILFILTTATSLIACNCPIESIQDSRERSIKDSELIFTAKVILTDSSKGFFRIEVIDVFKGEITGQIDASTAVDSIGTLHTCGFWPSPYWGEKFIVYANRIKGTALLYIDQCSATRSLSNPNIHLSYPANEHNDRKQRRLAISDLNDEIEILRKLNAR